MKLPDKPSELILLALHDLEQVEADPRYEIRMRAWHQPNGKCAVCAAGAVMAKTLGTDRSAHLDPTDFDFVTRHKLFAINALRTGAIGYACDELRLSLPDSLPYRFDVGDDMDRLSVVDREEWKQRMLGLAGILQAEGL